MGVKITSKKAARVAAETEQDAERASMVDELFELTQWLEGSGAKAKIARIDVLKKALTADVNDRFEDRAMARTIPGTLARVEVGAGSCKREVTNPRFVQQVVGDDAFYEGITVPLGFVDKYLSPDEQLQCVTETPGAGARTVKVFQL